MKDSQDDTARNLDRLLALHARPSSDDMNAAIDRVWERGGSRIGDAMADASVAASNPRPGSAWKIAYATTLAVAVAILIAVPAVFLPRLQESVVHASVEFVDGSLYRTSPAAESRMKAGETIRTGETVRSAKDGGAVLALVDGSRIEMRPESELALEAAKDGASIQLSAGSVIVTAAKQRRGHLYVQTKDVSVSVVGTVFLVNAEQAGSRVAVIQGEVQVLQGAATRKLVPGEQVATNPLMESHPIREEISWSRHAEEHAALLQQTAANAVPQRLQFEAATVKSDPIQNPFAVLSCKGVNGILPNGRPLRNPLGDPPPPPPPQGRCGGSASLRNLISIAYDVRGDHIAMDEDLAASFYRIEAKAEDPSTATKEQLLQMLQNLVIDRFNLEFTAGSKKDGDTFSRPGKTE